MKTAKNPADTIIELVSEVHEAAFKLGYEAGRAAEREELMTWIEQGLMNRSSRHRVRVNNVPAPPAVPRERQKRTAPPLDGNLKPQVRDKLSELEREFPQGVVPSEIADRLQLPATVVRQTLRALTDDKAVRRLAHGRFLTTNQPELPAAE